MDNHDPEFLKKAAEARARIRQAAAETIDARRAARMIAPGEVSPAAQVILDVRRAADHAASNEALPGAIWKNPDAIDTWIDAIPRNQDVVLYCVRGGSVSNAIVDALRAAGVRARFIEGGFEAWKAAGGRPVAK